MIQNADIEITRGDTEVVLIPVADSDDPDNAFVDPFPTASDVQYVIASEYSDESRLYDAPVSDIDIQPFGDVKPDSPALPDSYPTVTDSQPVIRVIVPREETAALAPTTAEDADDLVHDCQLSNDLGEQVTVMQGSVTVRPSATVEGRDA